MDIKNIDRAQVLKGQLEVCKEQVDKLRSDRTAQNLTIYYGGRMVDFYTNDKKALKKVETALIQFFEERADSIHEEIKLL